MTSATSTQVVYESFLTCSPNGPPRSMRYFSAIVFQAGTLRDAYLVDPPGGIATDNNNNSTTAADGGGASAGMQYVAQASPDLLLDWMKMNKARTRNGSHNNSHDQAAGNDNMLCGIFVRDPVTPEVDGQQNQSAKQQQQQQHQLEVSRCLETPNAIPFSSQSRVRRQIALASEQQQQQQQHEQEPPTAQQQQHTPSHSFLSESDVESLIQHGVTGSPAAPLTDGVLFLVDALLPRTNFLFNLCECHWFAGKLATTTYRVSMRKLDDDAAPLSERCDVVLPAAGGNDHQKQEKQEQQPPKMMSLTPDQHERLRITKILTSVNTPMTRMCRELAGRGFTHISAKFFLLFCPAEKKPAPSAAALAAAKQHSPERHHKSFGADGNAQPWLSSVHQSYAKPTVGKHQISWKPQHMTTTTASSSSPSASPASSKQHHKRPNAAASNNKNATSSGNGTTDPETNPGEWFFVGAQQLQQPLRAAVTEFLAEQRPERLMIMKMIEEEEEQHRQAAEIAAKQQQQHVLPTLVSQQQQQQQRPPSSPKRHLPSDRPASSQIDDDDDISWDPRGSRAGSAHPSDRGAGAAVGEKPPRPSSTGVLSGHGANDNKDNNNNSGIATRASSAATPPPRLSPLHPRDTTCAPPLNVSSSVVHRDSSSVPGALVIHNSSNNNSSTALSPIPHQHNTADDQHLPSIQEMWERRLRDGGPRRHLITTQFDSAVRRQAKHHSSSAAASKHNTNSHDLSTSLVPLTQSEILAKQLRLSPGPTFGGGSGASKHGGNTAQQQNSSKFLSRLSRFLDDEQTRVGIKEQERLQELQLEEERRHHAELEAQLAAEAEAAAAANNNNNENGDQPFGGGGGPMDPNALHLSASQQAQIDAASPKSRAEMRRLMLLRSEASYVSPLDKIKQLYDASSFHNALEGAYMDLFSERLEKPDRLSELDVMKGKDQSAGATSKRTVRLPSETQAREAVDFFADVGVMAEYEVIHDDDDDDSDDDDDADTHDNDSNTDNDEQPSTAGDGEEGGVDVAAENSKTPLSRRASKIGGVSRRQSVAFPDVEKNKKNNNKKKKKATPLDLALAGCAPAALVSVFIPDNARVAARLLATTLWKAETVARTLDRLSRWQQDTIWHMYSHGTATLHRCFDMVLFQQDPTAAGGATTTTTTGGSSSPESGGATCNNNNNKNNNADDGADGEQERRRKEEEDLRAHAQRLMQIQALLSEEETKRGRALHLEQCERTLITGMNSDHEQFLRAMCPDFVAAAAVAKRKAMQQEQLDADGVSGGGGLSPALGLLSQAALIRREIDQQQHEERQEKETAEEKFRRDVAVQELDARIALGKREAEMLAAAAAKERDREQAAAREAEEKKHKMLQREEESRQLKLEQELKMQRQLAARGGTMPSAEKLREEQCMLRELLVSEVLRRREASARAALVKEAMSTTLELVSLFLSHSSALNNNNKKAVFFPLAADEWWHQQHGASEGDDDEHLPPPSRFASGRFSRRKNMMAQPPATTLNDIIVLRECVVVETFMTRETLMRQELEKHFVTELQAEMVGLYAAIEATTKMQPRSRAATATAQRLQDYRLMLVIDWFVCKAEAKARAAIWQSAAVGKMQLTEWFVKSVPAVKLGAVKSILPPPPSSVDPDEQQHEQKQQQSIIDAPCLSKRPHPKTTEADVAVVRALLLQQTVSTWETAERELLSARALMDLAEDALLEAATIW